MKASSARHRSLIAAFLRDTWPLPSVGSGAAPMRRHRSVSPRCGTCLRFPAAGAARSRSSLSFPVCHRSLLPNRSAAAAVRCCPAVSVVQIGAQNARLASLSPAPQVSHTGSRKASASPGFLHACLARHCSAPLSLCAQTPSERKPSSARYRSLITASPRDT